MPPSTGSEDATSRPRRVTWWRKAAFALLPSLILLLCLELIAGFLCRSRFAPYQTHIGIQGDSAWAADPSLIWTNRPLYLQYDRSAQHNRYGMRVAPGQIELPSKGRDDFWVFCLGGSAMAGAGSAWRGDWLKITGQSNHSIEQAIDGQLEKILQEALPDRTVRVFNAAVPAHSLEQSRLMYRKLRHLQADWVVSMDGFNEPAALAEHETSREWLEQKWRKIPVNRPPLRQLRFLMRNSSFFYLFGEQLLLNAGIIKNPSAAQRDPDVFGHWLEKDAPPNDSRRFQPGSDERRAADRFLESLRDFDAELTADGQRHLLLVQPYLGLRERSKAGPVEQALLNYYAHHRDPAMDAFMGSLHRRLVEDADASHQIASAEALHDSSQWIFLDHCHLALPANEIIAREIARHILSDGAYRAFSDLPL